MSKWSSYCRACLRVAGMSAASGVLRTALVVTAFSGCGSRDDEASPGAAAERVGESSLSQSPSPDAVARNIRPAVEPRTAQREDQHALTLHSLVGTDIDWCVQGVGDCRGISRAVYEEDRGLVLRCRLNDGQRAYKHGQAFVDLKYIAPLEGIVPIDLTGHTVTVEIKISKEGSARPVATPNGLQVFTRDDKDRLQYGTWHNWSGAGTVTASLKPSRAGPAGGYTDQGFDPTACKFVGIKIGTSRSLSRSWEGDMVVKRASVDPPLAFPPAPRLPPGIPLPHFSADSKITVAPDGFYVDGNKSFLVGGNWRIIGYGQNFGTTAWFPTGNGVSKHRGYVAGRLRNFRRAGIQLIRVGLLDDGRAVLDQRGTVTGFNDTFRADVAALLDAAATHKVKVEFVLVDFHVAGRGENVGGVWIRGRTGVLANTELRVGFLENFVEPFLTTFGRHEALFGIDVINEPEWIVAASDGGAWESVRGQDKAPRPISGTSLRDFITRCAERIHRLAPNKFVTVGVSCKHLDLVSDIEVLDYVAPHYYPWMGELEENLVTVPAGKPYLLEEFPGRNDVRNYLTRVRNAGGSGALLWNLSPAIDDQSPSFKVFGKMLVNVRGFLGGVK